MLVKAMINHPPFITINGLYKPSNMGGLLLLYPHYTLSFLSAGFSWGLYLESGIPTTTNQSHTAHMMSLPFPTSKPTQVHSNLCTWAEELPGDRLSKPWRFSWLPVFHGFRLARTCKELEDNGRFDRCLIDLTIICYMVTCFLCSIG